MSWFNRNIKNLFNVGAIVAAVLACLVLIFFTSSGHTITADSTISFLLGIMGAGIVVLAGYAIKACSIFKQRKPWIYSSTASAIQEFAINIPHVEEVIFVGYISRMFSGDLRALRNSWHIQNLRLLLRDLDTVTLDQKGQIPKDDEVLEKRRKQAAFGLEDIQDGLGKHLIGKTTVRYFTSHPVLRGVLVRFKDEKGQSNEIGFMSFYRCREHKNGRFDYSARNSPVFRLSHENKYEKYLLDSFVKWFEFLWNSGSYEK